MRERFDRYWPVAIVMGCAIVAMFSGLAAWAVVVLMISTIGVLIDISEYLRAIRDQGKGTGHDRPDQ